MPLGKWTKERGCEARKGQAIEFDQCAVKVDDQLDIVAPYRMYLCKVKTTLMFILPRLKPTTV